MDNGGAKAKGVTRPHAGYNERSDQLFLERMMKVAEQG